MKFSTKIIRLIIIILAALPYVTKAQTEKPADHLYALIYSTGPQWDSSKSTEQQPYFSAHSQYLSTMRREGLIAIGGRYTDKGFILLKSKSIEEARRLVMQDSSILHGTFKVEVHAFEPFYYGSIEPPGQAMSLTGSTLAVSDMDSMLNFYTSVFNCRFKKEEAMGSIFYHTTIAGIDTRFCPNKIAMVNAEKNRQQFEYQVSNIEEMLKKALANGGHQLGGLTRQNGFNTTTLIDPDGNTIIISQKL